MPTQKDNETGIAKLLSDFARQKEEYELTKVKCGFVGRRGVGNSSLINAITGEKLAAVGFTKETTAEPHEYLHRGLVLPKQPLRRDCRPLPNSTLTDFDQRPSDQPTSAIR
jgi:hypothetical protein